MQVGLGPAKIPYSLRQQSFVCLAPESPFFPDISLVPGSMPTCKTPSSPGLFFPLSCLNPCLFFVRPSEGIILALGFQEFIMMFGLPKAAVTHVKAY